MTGNRTPRRGLPRLTRIFFGNWIATLGTILAAAALALLVLGLMVHIYYTVTDTPTNPYLNLVSFMVLPLVLAAGVALIVYGGVVWRRRELRQPQTVAIEVGGADFLRKVAVTAVAAVVLFFLVGSFSYQAYHFTDSPEFCLKVCHQVMAPEGVAYERSPHAHVRCVECHIGPGASWFVRSKISGLRQVAAVLTGDYHRPIPTPVENLRPARETCEHCHWPAKFHGAKLVVHERRSPDRDNTLSVTSLVVKVGGSPKPGLPSTGVHWHVDPRNRVRYRSLDRRRTRIVEVVQQTPDGEVTYRTDEADSAGGEWRTMDCIDCHNRPTHIFQRPGDAVDAAFAAGDLDPAVPWLRGEAERALREVVPGAATADSLAAWLRDAYRVRHPDDLPALESVLARTAAVLAGILEGNVFPSMNITWGTYPDLLGHRDVNGEIADVGCFRCHDEEHESDDGRVISQDCDACHLLLAEDEADPENWPEFLSDLVTAGGP